MGLFTGCFAVGFPRQAPYSCRTRPGGGGKRYYGEFVISIRLGMDVVLNCTSISNELNNWFLRLPQCLNPDSIIVMISKTVGRIDFHWRLFFVSVAFWY